MLVMRCAAVGFAHTENPSLKACGMTQFSQILDVLRCYATQPKRKSAKNKDSGTSANPSNWHLPNFIPLHPPTVCHHHALVAPHTHNKIIV